MADMLRALRKSMDCQLQLMSIMISKAACYKLLLPRVFIS